MEAISVVIQHWLVEQNRICRNQHQQLQERICMRIILNRRGILFFQDVMEELAFYPEDENLRETAKCLVEDLVDTKQIWGFCPLCHLGKIRFFIVFMDVHAKCKKCKFIYQRWENLYL